jgi:hypothetical protein
MRQWLKYVGWIHVVMATVSAQSSELVPNRYAPIAKRNAFRLEPPPKSTGATVQTNTLPGLTLAGVAQLGSDKFALFTREHSPADLSYVLRMGQREDDLEVLSIDVKAGIASVRQGGVERVLSLNTQRQQRTPPETELAEQPLFERHFQPGEPRPDGV